MLYRRQIVAQMIYAMALPFVIILLRGTIPDTLSRMLFLVVPFVLFMVLRIVKQKVGTRIFGRHRQKREINAQR